MKKNNNHIDIINTFINDISKCNLKGVVHSDFIYNVQKYQEFLKDNTLDLTSLVDDESTIVVNIDTTIRHELLFLARDKLEPRQLELLSRCLAGKVTCDQYLVITSKVMMIKNIDDEILEIFNIKPVQSLLRLIRCELEEKE